MGFRIALVALALAITPLAYADRFGLFETDSAHTTLDTFAIVGALAGLAFSFVRAEMGRRPFNFLAGFFGGMLLGGLAYLLVTMLR